MQNLIFHIDIDAFFVACEIKRRPELKNKPVVIADERFRRGVVATASYEARVFGVHSAMPVFQAKKLCKDCIFIKPDFEFYEQESSKFFRILKDFAEQIEPASLDEAFIPFGRLKFIKDPIEYALLIKKTVEKALNFTVSCGLGPTRLTAKLATESAKPEGFLYVPNSKIIEFMAFHRIEDIPGIGPKTARALKELGIHKVKELQEIDIFKLRKTFKNIAIYLKNMSYGKETPHFKPKRRKSISSETTLEEDISDPEAVSKILYQLSDKVAFLLRNYGYKAYGIGIKLKFSNFKVRSKRKSLNRAVIDHREIHRIAKELYREIGSSEKIRLIGVFVYNLSSHYIPDIFESDASFRFIQAIDRLRGKYGHNSIKFGKELN